MMRWTSINRSEIEIVTQAVWILFAANMKVGALFLAISASLASAVPSALHNVRDLSKRWMLDATRCNSQRQVDVLNHAMRSCAAIAKIAADAASRQPHKVEEYFKYIYQSPLFTFLTT